MEESLKNNRFGVLQSNTFWQFQGWGLILIVFLSFFPKFFHYQEYFFFALLILAIGVSLINGQTIWIRTGLDWPIFLLVGWILVTLPFAVDQAHSLGEWRKLAGRFLVFYWALLVFLRHRQGEIIFHVILAVVVGALCISSYAIWGFVERGGTVVDRGVRALAPSSHSHWLATYLVIALPIVGFLLITVQSEWKRIILTLTLLIVGVAEFLTFSRGAWLAIAFQVGLGALVIGGKRFAFRAVLGVVICVVGLWVMHMEGYLGGIFAMQSVADRLGCWELGMREVLAHPFVGLGFGNNTFKILYPGEPPGECASGHIHNTFLMFTMGSGIPAFIFLVWIIIKGLKDLVASVRVPLASENDGYRIAIALTLVGFWICAFFNYLFTGSLAYLLLILLAAGLSLSLGGKALISPNREPS